ncbi:MAG: mandelate racemase/muconate lactonizing enzyme family protein [Bacillota bacterium]|jgi:L-alanine-DL-glutamate epimerase-like enolase superfamily enzyme
MRIVSARVIPALIPKKTAFKVAYATRTRAVSIFLRLDTDTGHVGWGESLPNREVTGEERDEVYRRLAEWTAVNLIGEDPFDTERIRLKMDADLTSMPSARCAIDTALWDLRGKALNRSLRQLLGNARPRIDASSSIGIMSLDKTVKEARALMNQGFRHIKVKIGLDLENDIARVKTMREQLGTDWHLYLDANQGYTAREAVDLVMCLADERVDLVEQPVPAEDVDSLAEVTRESPIPICADEAVKDSPSLIRILERRAAHMINVKLQKCGGPSEASLLVRMAESAGMKAMIGCMIESRVGITAGLSVALGLANVYYVDLDGAFDLADDVVTTNTGAQYAGGYQFLAEGPGLGLEIDESAMDRNTDRALMNV